MRAEIHISQRLRNWQAGALVSCFMVGCLCVFAAVLSTRIEDRPRSSDKSHPEYQQSWARWEKAEIYNYDIQVRVDGAGSFSTPYKKLIDLWVRDDKIYALAGDTFIPNLPISYPATQEEAAYTIAELFRRVKVQMDSIPQHPAPDDEYATEYAVRFNPTYGYPESTNYSRFMSRESIAVEHFRVVEPDAPLMLFADDE